MWRTAITLTAAWLTLCVGMAGAWAEEAAPDANAPAAAPAAASADDNSLAASQEALMLRFRRFEKTLRDMKEHMRKTEPERAALLTRAIDRTARDGVDRQMEVLVKLLNDKQFGSASERQDEIVVKLQALLDLLMSEDEAKLRKERMKQLKEYIDQVNKIIAAEKDIRAATERGAEGLAPRQENIAKKTEELRKKIDQDDSDRNAKMGDGSDSEGKPSAGKEGEDSEGKPSEGKPGEGKPSEGKPGEGKPGEEKQPGEEKPEGDNPDEGKPNEGKPNEGKPNEGKPNEGKPSEGKPSEGKPSEGKPSEGKPSEGKPSEGKPSEGKPSEGKPSEGKPSEGKPSEGKPSEGKPSEGKPSEGKPSEGKPSQSQDQPPQDTPVREELERARREMEQAIEKLKKQAHSDASNNQDQAIRELEKAKEKLEEILRQLREEERDKFLVALEARFQKMLQMQLSINNETVQLDKIPGEERASRHTAKSIQLSRQEEEVALEATKALTLLREEGTAVAFPEAVEQMRDDMKFVAGRLERFEVGELTQGVERDIVEALKEMIEALQKEIDKAKKKDQQQQQQQQQQQDQDPQLVETLAELKMLRSLQLRVNGRTTRLGRLVDGEQAVDPDVVNQLQRLSERQARIQKATYDLATGRNK
ncbi:MAG TPA: hypothetical protein VHB77_17580 [Planctomycetaceae bacterium]|nr:hypothetical protein [Planctomycetaceae bacterium]